MLVRKQNESDNFNYFNPTMEWEGLHFTKTGVVANYRCLIFVKNIFLYSMFKFFGKKQPGNL